MLVNNNAMITAIKDQNWAGVKRLCVSDPSMCQSKDSNGYLAIHHACSYGSPVEIVKEICNAYEHGMKITDVKGLLPLHLACVSDMSLEGSKYIHQLHQEGVEAKSKYGNIPLHLACQYASAEIIEYLHRMYPDGVTVKNDFDKTPLDSLKWRDQLRNDEDAILAIFNRIPSPLSMRPEISPNISDESHAKKSWHHDNQSLTENPNEADADSTILDAARKYVTVMDNWYAAKKARADAKINRRTQEKAVKETIESFQKAKARETLVTAKLKEAAAIADLNKANDEKEEANHLFHRNGDNNVLRSCATGTLDKMKQCFVCCSDYNEGRSEIDSSDCRPVTLPCCGKTICMDCVNKYRAIKIVDMKGYRKMVPCLLCKKPYHPQQTFVPNKDHLDFICDLRKHTHT